MSKTWFITGTSSGIGRILTEKLLERGDRVVATLRRAGTLDDLKARHGERLYLVTLDVTDTSAIRRVVAEAFAQMGHIDVVVSNAGYGLFGAAEEVTDSQLERQLATNLVGSIQLVRAVIPFLRTQGGGRIVQVSSEGGQIAYPGFSLYHATKWGIEGFLEAVAQEVAPFGVDFTIIEPGPTGTNFAASVDHADPLPCYEHTPANEVRRALTSGTFVIKGDAVNTTDALLAVADSPNPPFRLALGSTAYASIHRALSERLQQLELNEGITRSADVSGPSNDRC